MKKKIKKLWLEALNSGEYAQGRRFLCQKGKKYDTFCCLGVLCDIAVLQGLKMNLQTLTKSERATCSTQINSISFKVESYDGRINILPHSIDVWAGLNTDKANTTLMKLILMNDEGKSFKAIAAVIEAEL